MAESAANESPVMSKRNSRRNGSLTSRDSAKHGSFNDDRTSESSKKDSLKTDLSTKGSQKSGSLDSPLTTISSNKDIHKESLTSIEDEKDESPEVQTLVSYKRDSQKTDRSSLEDGKVHEKGKSLDATTLISPKKGSHKTDRSSLTERKMSEKKKSVNGKTSLQVAKKESQKADIPITVGTSVISLEIEMPNEDKNTKQRKASSIGQMSIKSQEIKMPEDAKKHSQIIDDSSTTEGQKKETISDTEKKNQKKRMLKLGEGCVLKPCIKPDLAHAEMTFYHEVWSTEKNIIGILRNFIPEYKGKVVLKIKDKAVTFLKLADVSAGLEKPCIADIKIGSQTWEPNACPEKQIAEDMKYTECKKAYGFCIVGYQVHNITNGTFIKRDKKFGKALKKESLPDALREFLNYENQNCRILIDLIVQRLRQILIWWHQQEVVNIYGSSILVLYDAAQLETLSPDDEALLSYETVPWVRVYMIDFAHVIYPYKPNRDENYIHGLTNLIDVLSHL